MGVCVCVLGGKVGREGKCLFSVVGDREGRGSWGYGGKREGKGWLSVCVVGEDRKGREWVGREDRKGREWVVGEGMVKCLSVLRLKKEGKGGNLRERLGRERKGKEWVNDLV